MSQWRMLDIAVIDDPAAATALLDPIKTRLLAALVTPASAASLAGQMGLPRQKLNYHLRLLEGYGLIEIADERKWGGLTERRLIASARSYVVSPAALGAVASDPERTTDRLSAGYMIALAARAVREVGSLWRRARETDKRLATLSIDTEISFRSAADRADFTREVTAAIAALAARYHDPDAPGARSHRVMLMAHAKPGEPPTETQPCH